MDAPAFHGIKLCQSGSVEQPLKSAGASTVNITAIGIDLEKYVFQVHEVDVRGKAKIRRPLKRAQMKAFFANLPPCLIGMEACSSAHYWARELMTFGHIVRLMAPQFVKPYVKTNKNDMNDAEAICEAVTRPNMRFVAIKNAEQQALLTLHRVRQGFVHAQLADRHVDASSCLCPSSELILRRVSPGALRR